MPLDQNGIANLSHQRGVAKDTKIAIAADHAGFEQKQQLVQHLASLNWEVMDFGPYDDDRVDYPDYAAKVAKSVAGGECKWGVLICGTGIGMTISANKFPTIRAANCTSVEFAALAREHNDANVLALSARYVPVKTNMEIIDKFLVTPFGEARHTTRVQKIALIEKNICDDNTILMPTSSKP